MTNEAKTFQPNPLQTLFLWRLLAVGGEDWQKVIKPALKAPARKELEKAKLIETSSTKHGNHIELTDAGWSWAANHLNAEVSKTSPAAGPVLQLFLTRLKAFLADKDVALGDFVTQTDATIKAGASPHDDNGHATPPFESRLRETYRRLAHDRWSTEVRLSDLRRQFGDIPRQEFDDRLRRMEATEQIVLYPLDDPRQIGMDDEAAALPNSLGNPRHVLLMDRK